MRRILIDYLISTNSCLDYSLNNMALTVNVLDRFCDATRTVQTDTLQFIGVTALYIASKFEERVKMSQEDVLTLTCNDMLERADVCKMEARILDAINFGLLMPTAVDFVDMLFLFASHVDNDQRTVAKQLASYFVEMTLLEYDMLVHSPSMVAAASTWLSLKTMGYTPWTVEMTRRAGYAEAHICACVAKIHKLHLRASQDTLRAVHEKYGAYHTPPRIKSTRSDVALITPLRTLKRLREEERRQAEHRDGVEQAWTVGNVSTAPLECDYSEMFARMRKKMALFTASLGR